MVGLHVMEYTYFGFRGYGDSHGDSNGDSCGYGKGMGIEMPPPRQPCTLHAVNKTLPIVVVVDAAHAELLRDIADKRFRL